MWVEQKLKLEPVAFQNTDVKTYGLTLEQCSQSVYVLCGQKTYSGADAIAFLLKSRGNSMASGLLRFSGPLGGMGYRWIASHRNSRVVQSMKWFLDRSNEKARSHES